VETLGRDGGWISICLGYLNPMGYLDRYLYKECL